MKDDRGESDREIAGSHHERNRQDHEAVCEEREALEYALDEDLDYDRIYQILREVRGAEYQIRRALNKLQVLKDYAEYEDE